MRLLAAFQARFRVSRKVRRSHAAEHLRMRSLPFAAWGAHHRDTVKASAMAANGVAAPLSRGLITSCLFVRELTAWPLGRYSLLRVSRPVSRKTCAGAAKNKQAEGYKRF